MAEVGIISIKAMVDKEKNEVLFVESDKDFVDLLLSFLTLPLGTITRLIRDINSQSLSTPAFGCIENLYKSIEDLDVNHFSTEECKNMLLFPRRAAEQKCNGLKLKIDLSEPTKYCYCTSYRCYWNDKLFIATPGTSKCFRCSTLCNEVNLMDFQVTGCGVFVKGRNAGYIVTDDLHVTSGSVGACMSMLGVHGIHDWSRLEERNVDLSPKEVLSLLKHSLISKSPLTDLILLKGGESSKNVKIKPRATCTLYSNGEEATNPPTSAKVSVTLVSNKSTNKTLYASVKDDFVDLLFSFLTLPLASIVKLCGGTSSIGCIDNLYRSVEDLSSQGHIISQDCKDILVNPKLATHFRSVNQLMEDEVENKYMSRWDRSSFILNSVAGSACSYNNTKMMINPKLPVSSETKSGGQFVAGPATYMVTNDLVVTPLYLITGLNYLKSQNVPINDVEERVVTVGKQEAFNILMASLLSDSALDGILGSTDEAAHPTGLTGPAVKMEKLDGI